MTAIILKTRTLALQRRIARWLSLLAIVMLFGLAAPCAVSGRQPHMVIYISDDHSQFDSSLYGAADIPTPNFEKLAADGMMFSHAFVASPSCAPSRAAMLTGLMPARNGAEANHTYPRPGAHYLVTDLQAIGYEVVAFGKVAHGRGVRDVGFHTVTGGASFTALRRSVTEYLTKRTSDQPLCLFAGISNPHVPWPNETRFDPRQVVFPPTHLDTPATRDHRASYYQEIKEVDQLLGELRDLAGKHLGENVLFIHTSDHGSQWPFGKWTLYDYGIRVPFLASWPGVIQAGAKSDAMISWIDLLPTLIEVAAGEVPSGLDGRSFASVLRGQSDSHRDQIFTTHSGDGNMNIYPIRSVRTRKWKLIHNLYPQYAFTNHSDLLQRPGAGAFWSEWAALAKIDSTASRVVDRYYRRPEWELYRVDKDKWEQENLATDSAHETTMKDLKKQLADWMIVQGDQATVFNDPRPLDQPLTWHPDFERQRSEQLKRK